MTTPAVSSAVPPVAFATRADDEGVVLGVGVGVVVEQVAVTSLADESWATVTRVVVRHRGVVDARDVDRDVPGVRAAVAVDDGVVEAAGARAAEVRGGREGDGAGGESTVPPVGFETSLTVRASPLPSVSLPVRSPPAMTSARVLGGRDRVVVRDGGDVECALDVDRDVARVGAAVAVVDGVVEAALARAALVGGGRERDHAGGPSTEPPVALSALVTDRLSPSVSVSLARIADVTSLAVESCSTVTVSSLATGVSLTQVRSMLTWPVSVPPLPSSTV